MKLNSPYAEILHKTHAALSVFQETESGSWVLPSRSEESPFRMPISSEKAKTFVILRQGDHFVTSSGRWSVALVRDSSTGFKTDKPSVTRPTLSKSPTVVGMAPPPSKDRTVPEKHKHESISDQFSKEDLQVAEAIPILSNKTMDQVSSQVPISANKRLHNAAEAVHSTRTGPSMDLTEANLSDLPPIEESNRVRTITAVPNAADYDHLNVESNIAIHADSSAEDSPSALEGSQEDKYLKELSTNLPFETEDDKGLDETSKKSWRSVFGNQTLQPAPEKVEMAEAAAASPPPSQEGIEQFSMNSAAADAGAEHKGNGDRETTTEQLSGRKDKQTKNAAVRQATTSKKRKGGVSSETADGDSDTIRVVPRSAKKTQGMSSRNSRVSRVSVSRKSRKVDADGSPLDSTRSRVIADEGLTMPDATPSAPKGRRASAAKLFPGPRPKIIFSSSTTVDGKNKIMESFRSFGGSVVKSIDKADILCVSSGALKKTTKFISAVASGKNVVDERWLVESHRKGVLLDQDAFVPKDTEHEREWGFDLKVAIERGKAGLIDLLDNVPIYFTRQLELDLGRNFKDFCKIAEMLGAVSMGVTLPTTPSMGETTVVIGVDNDPQAPEVRMLGLRLRQRDLLVLGVLRGVVDLESDEFVIEALIKSEGDE